ncbi:MAG: AAA family ATPase [archaeon]|nr:AAA family ATPase [archaeon]
MLNRKIYSRLLEWKSRTNHKALVVKGQRQVGKTFIIREFAKNEYEHLIEFNFSLDMDVRTAFEGNLRADDIIRGLMAFHDPSHFIPGKCLIFFDEVQDYPSAWASLKAFTEDGRFDVIASGSRLGIDINVEDRNGTEIGELLPTGYQTFLTMKPLDFEEFLWANGITPKQVQEVRTGLRSRQMPAPALAKRFSELFREYLIVGGMPEAVSSFISEKNYSQLDRILSDILVMCHQDISRYNHGVDKVKTAECFDSIPRQLANTNKKFMYSRMECNYSRKSAEKYMNNLLWIKYSGLGLFCHALSQPTSPIRSNEMKDTFRVYLSDTGLLLNQYGREALRAVKMGDSKYNCGALLENQIAICLDHAGFTPHFYRKNDGPGKLDIDFIVETARGVVAIEVKSGKDRDAPSIRKASRLFTLGGLVQFEDCSYHVDEEGVEHLPLFTAAFFGDLFPEEDRDIR